MLQVVVEVEQGFLWSYKGFYASYKVFYGEQKPSSDQSNSTICDKYDLNSKRILVSIANGNSQNNVSPQ